jgi:transcription initiation factor TFIIIB Brf1 subunit/transcription initiation factor TFIIB
MDRTSARRDHIELQINLLAEQEATRSLDVLQRIADHLNVPNVKDSQAQELAQDTAVDAIARDLKAREIKESKSD